jgi:hypothetical protein
VLSSGNYEDNKTGKFLHFSFFIYIDLIMPHSRNMIKTGMGSAFLESMAGKEEWGWVPWKIEILLGNTWQRQMTLSQQYPGQVARN